MARQAGLVPEVRVGLIVRQPPRAIRLTNDRGNSIPSLNSLIGDGKFGLCICAFLELCSGGLVLGLLSHAKRRGDRLEQPRQER